VACVVVLLAAAALSTAASGHGVEAGVFAATAAAIAVLVVVCRRLQPVAYRIEPDGLVIERRGAGPRVFRGVVGEPRAGRLTVRLVGSGGLGGYLGVFALAGGGRARAYVTDRRRAVVVHVGDRDVAISPADALGGGDA
jgi:Bacterial PH domain